eukprot:CAMPEP_0113687428 /NCGR_PEP_ID=MMETSP0038_2-20120614/15928_1 /TAXON_ID=2898 /ORGANISM="Cryptomonas paramecium" /LENGTH=213 /DNA_ID=CAMNT_0000608037 /DNA_START=215 /DNA_END=852 /DNA_ORIENTATION=+ /assembly_acc=CAM_ASM_000170
MNFFGFGRRDDSDDDDDPPNGPQSKAQPYRGQLILSQLAREGDLEAVESSYKENRKSIRLKEEKDANGNTPCHWAALHGHDKVLAFLLSKRFDASVANDDGDTPMHYAASGGSASAIRVLLQRGADPWPRNFINATPLHFAAAEGHLEVARTLLSNAPSRLALQVLPPGTSSLFETSWYDAVTSDGDTPLHWAAASGGGGGPQSVLAALLEAR